MFIRYRDIKTNGTRRREKFQGSAFTRCIAKQDDVQTRVMFRPFRLLQIKAVMVMQEYVSQSITVQVLGQDRLVQNEFDCSLTLATNYQVSYAVFGLHILKSCFLSA